MARGHGARRACSDDLGALGRTVARPVTRRERPSGEHEHPAGPWAHGPSAWEGLGFHLTPDECGSGEGVAYQLRYGVPVVTANREVYGRSGRILHVEGDIRKAP
jgi:hypothetical protein